MDRSSLRRTYDTSQRNKYIALAAGIVTFIVLWILVIVWLGQAGSAEPSEQAAPAAPATTAQEPADPEDTTAGEPRGQSETGGEGGTDDSADTLGGGGEGSEEGGSQTAQSAGGGTQPSEVFDPLEEDGSTGETDEVAPEGSEPGSQTDLQTDPQTDPQTADYSPESEATGGDGQAPEGGEDMEDAEDTQQDEGTGQPAGAETTTDTDLARAKAASESYLTAAYGYTGTSAEDYLGGIEEAASEEVFGSPGGEKLESYSEAAPACGMVSTVILDQFEVIGNGPDGLDALTTFSVEDADGQTHRFSQEHRLSALEGAYQVSAVSVEELISDTTPRESCPGSANENPDDESVTSGEDSGKPGEGLDVGQKEQVRSAADRFITAAYGYTGDSEKQYREAIERTTVSTRFFESPGGNRIDGYAGRVSEQGMEAAAKMERFEVTGTSGEDIQGLAYFEVGSSYDRYANVEGETTAYRQRLALSPYEGSYRVSAAGTEEQIANEGSNESENERKLTK